jgi:uncharacterized membrane protein YccC
MSIVLIVAIGVAILLVLAFFAMNRWSSPSRDRQKSEALRTNRQMTEPERENRGTGIN